MPEYLSPGVYIEEQDTGPEPIEGVSTSVTGLVGVTQMGPLDTNPPVLVTSFPEYQRTFGTYFTPQFSTTPPDSDSYNLMPHAVAGFFNNGGQLLYVKRVGRASGGGANPPSSASVGHNLENFAGAPTIMTRLDQSAVPNGVNETIYVAATVGIQVGSQITLNQTKNGISSSSGALTVASYNDQTSQVTFSAPIPTPTPASANATYYDSNYTTVVVSGAYTPGPNASFFLLNAGSPGAWANPQPAGDIGLQVQITPSSRAQAQIQALPSSTQIQLTSGASFYAGAIIEINTGTSKFYAKVSSISGASLTLLAALSAAATTAINANLSATPVVPTWVKTWEFDIAASYGHTSESFPGLNLDPTTPYYFANAIANGSSLLSVPTASLTPTPPPADLTTMPVAIDGLDVTLAGGSDGDCPLASDYAGNDGGPGNRTGITALIDASDISIIAAPGKTDQTTQNALIAQCETLKYRFAILDPQPTPTAGAPTMTTIQTQRDLYDTEYAAIYFPRIVVSDPLSGNPLPICPSGHMAGIYAQTDDTRGVWKAPANVVINGILRLETKLSKGDQDILNPEPNNINALRDFTAQGRGLRVYGARVITSDQEWKYINVRRLFIFLEASLDQGTQWAVFEPNDQTLWNRLIQSVSAFLTTIWQQGGLMGATADQAFFVKCGYDTMSSDDIENGRLIMLVGVAPVFPAEFVIIRIGQWAGGSAVQEL